MAKRKVESQIGNLTPDHKMSRITLISLCSGDVRHTVGKLLTKATTLLETSSQSNVCTQNYEPKKLWESQFWEFQDSHLGVPGQNDIWVLVPWLGTKYIRRGKVVASPKSGPWWVLWVHVCPWFVHAPKCSNSTLTNLLFDFYRSMWVLNCLLIFLVLSQSSSMPLYPRSVASQRMSPNSFSFHCFHLWTQSSIHQGAWGCITNLECHITNWCDQGKIKKIYKKCSWVLKTYLHNEKNLPLQCSFIVPPTIPTCSI
jgi:hypothetical protein